MQALTIESRCPALFQTGGQRDGEGGGGDKEIDGERGCRVRERQINKERKRDTEQAKKRGGGGWGIEQDLQVL